MFNISPVAHLLRAMLLCCAIGMLVLAAFFLRSRKLSELAYLGWGVIAIMLPVLGPFLVIWFCRGEKTPPACNPG